MSLSDKELNMALRRSLIQKKVLEAVTKAEEALAEVNSLPGLDMPISRQLTIVNSALKPLRWLA